MRENAEEKQDRRERDRWHVGKEIPLALIGAIFLQTVGGVWWAAQITTKVDNMKEQLITLSANQFSAAEARSMVTVNTQHNTEQDRRIQTLEERVRDIERSRR